MKRLDATQCDRLRQSLESLEKEVQGHADRLVAVQEALLPKELPELPGFRAAVSLQPCQVVGGDWYGIVPFTYGPERAARHVAIAVGDVCGHDVSATVVMAIVLAILRCYRAIPANPADVMRHLNARLCEMDLPNGFTTAFIGFLSLDDLRLAYCTAGHPLPLVRRPCGQLRPLDGSHGFPLGAFDDARCQGAEETLEPGSLLCLYTDGITDTKAPTGTRYGLERLTKILSAARGGPAKVVDRILADLGRHQGPAGQVDDRTLLVAQMLKWSCT